MPRVGAIDCGTNSIRLLVADVTVREDGSRWLRDVHRDTRIVRLGQGVDATGMFVPEAIERTRVELAEYTAILRRKGAERVRMVATSATRDAGNREDFFGMVRETLGAEAEVISGHEEATLSFQGAVADLEPEDGPFMVVDLGGGSTEVVLGEWDGVRATVLAARSVDIGCVRITERCLHSDPPTAAELAEAGRVVDAELAKAFEVVDVSKARTWVGVAGTMTTLSGIAMDLPRYDSDAIHLSRLQMDDLLRTTEQVLGMPREQRAALGVMHPGRVDVIGGGALVTAKIASELRERAGIGELVVSEHDILDGIALSIV